MIKLKQLIIVTLSFLTLISTNCGGDDPESSSVGPSSNFPMVYIEHQTGLNFSMKYYSEIDELSI